jgi:hypothetical protein
MPGFAWVSDGDLHPAIRPGASGVGSKMNERKPMGQQKPMDTAATTRSKKPSAKPAKLSREVQARLGQQLRALYDDVVSQGVPDRFANLLNRLDGNGNKDQH